MRKRPYINPLLTLFLTFNTLNLCAQINSDQKEYYTLFDNFIGVENTDIFEGYEYKERYVTLDGNHKYFLSPDYITGDIYYKGQPYFDIELKYDLYTDELIAKLYQGNKFSVIRLIKEKIDHFAVNNHFFVRLTVDNSIVNNNFYEQSFSGENLILFKKHFKLRTEHLDKDFAYSEFNYGVEYLLKFNNKYHLLNTKRSLIKLFPHQKKSIHSLFRSNRKLLPPEESDINMINLMKIIDNDLIDENLSKQ